MLEKAIEMARKSAPEICMQAALAIKAEKLEPQHRMELAELISRLLGGLEMQLRYLQSYDLDEWKEFCTNMIVERGKVGIPYASVMRAGQILITAQLEFYKKTLGGDPNLKLDGIPASRILEKLERRLQALDSVSSAVAIAVGLKEKAQTK